MRKLIFLLLLLAGCATVEPVHIPQIKGAAQYYGYIWFPDDTTTVALKSVFPPAYILEGDSVYALIYTTDGTFVKLDRGEWHAAPYKHPRLR